MKESKCKKATFETLDMAISRSHEIENEARKSRRDKPKTMRAYECNDCGKFHLTTKSKFEYLSNSGKVFKPITPQRIQERIQELKNKK